MTTKIRTDDPSIHSYAVFVHIKDDDGTIRGRIVRLRAKQYEVLESLILTAPEIEIDEDPYYEIEFKVEEKESRDET